MGKKIESKKWDVLEDNISSKRDRIKKMMKRAINEVERISIAWSDILDREATRKECIEELKNSLKKDIGEIEIE